MDAAAAWGARQRNFEEPRSRPLKNEKRAAEEVRAFMNAVMTTAILGG
jgi:hypothetical protein